ncbi:hypothetical protein [Flavonifractor porci]
MGSPQKAGLLWGFITCCEEMSLDRLGEGKTFHIHNGVLVG